MPGGRLLALSQGSTLSVSGHSPGGEELYVRIDVCKHYRNLEEGTTSFMVREGVWKVSPVRGVGIKPGVSTPGSESLQPIEPRRGAGSEDRPVVCLRPFGASGEGVGALPGVETPGFMPTPLRG
jgi:hypothetical protein